MSTEQCDRTNRVLYLMAMAAAPLTFALLLAGATVTTLDVGMADTVWPTAPWYLVVLIAGGQALQHGLGFFIEHVHRLVGWLVGFLVVAFVVLAWGGSGGRKPRAASVALLILVAVQGVLGGMRVLFVSRELAVLHGILAHAFFTLCVVVALSLKPGRTDALKRSVGGENRRLGSRLRAAQAAFGLVVLQIVTGTALRHLGIGLHLHILGAVLASLACAGLGFGLLFVGERTMFPIRGWLLLGGGLVQLLLGVAAWLTASGFGPYALEPVSLWHALAATAHMLLGSLLLASTASVVPDLVLLTRTSWLSSTPATPMAPAAKQV